MLRRAALVTFGTALVFAAACGHQVTPSPPGEGGNLAGSMLIRFRTTGAMNFSQYDYQIVFDTCGGGVPYPQAAFTTFTDYTFSLNIGATQFGAATAVPIQIQYILTTGTSNQLNPINVPLTSSQVTLTPNDNGQGNEFTLTFPRAIFNDPLGPSAPPCSSSSVSPGPVTPSPTVSAGASPTTSPSSTSSPSSLPAASTSPSPGQSATPFTLPTTLAQSTWRLNFFVVNVQSRQVVDTLGPGGATDNSFGGVNVDTTTTNNQPVNKLPSITASDAAAQIVGGEVDNFQ